MHGYSESNLNGDRKGAISSSLTMVAQNDSIFIGLHCCLSCILNIHGYCGRKCNGDAEQASLLLPLFRVSFTFLRHTSQPVMPANFFFSLKSKILHVQSREQRNCREMKRLGQFHAQYEVTIVVVLLYSMKPSRWIRGTSLCTQSTSCNTGAEY